MTAAGGLRRSGQEENGAVAAGGTEPSGLAHSDPWNAAVGEGRELDLAEYPSALLMRVASIIQQNGTAAYARKHGLSVPEWRILGRLCKSAPMQLAVLCRVSYFDKAQASRVLRALSARGLVRMYPQASHRHRRIVDITPEGRALAESVFPEALAEQGKLLRTLTAEERRITFDVLRRLLDMHGVDMPAPAATYRETPD